MTAEWTLTKDGDPRGYELFRRHYTFNPKRDQMSFWKEGSDSLFVGPGEKVVLIHDRALFVWRREKFRQDDQTGIDCAVFRNEGAGLSSDLIRAADVLAFERWPGQRHFTFIDGRKTRRKRDPGRCFLRAGWRYVRDAAGKRAMTKSGLFILEIEWEWTHGPG